MSWISDSWPALGFVVGKAVLMYTIALGGLRLGERRTLAEWAIIDFVTAVAIGAIVGRTAIAGTQSLLTGSVALLTLIVVHRLASWLRCNTAVGPLLQHKVRVLVEHGRVHHRQLRRCGLTPNDLFAQLRLRGVLGLEGLRYVLYEATGDLTIVPDDADLTGEALQSGLRGALGLDRPQP